MQQSTREVGDSNVLDQAGIDELLHRLPGLAVRHCRGSGELRTPTGHLTRHVDLGAAIGGQVNLLQPVGVVRVVEAVVGEKRGAM